MRPLAEKTEIRPLVAGTITQLRVRENQAVRKSDTLLVLRSVRLLLHSSQYIQQQAALVPPPPSATPAATPASVLSKREQEILALLAQGYSLPQIGDKLFISPATVTNHCARMREKLGLRGRNALVVFSRIGSMDSI